MLSISNPITTGQGHYYVNLAKEDYYIAGGEPPGLWFGRGAFALGLTNRVERREFQNLLRGFSPYGEKRLVQDLGKNRKRQAGYDLCFSAPKGWSSFWSVADQETRSQLQKLQLAAVHRALEYLEDVAAFTRRGKNGKTLEKCKLIFALFEHGTSRAQDPHMHTHAVLLNLSIREDGSTGAIMNNEFFRHKMTAGALYRAELAYGAEKLLGLEIERAVQPKQPREFHADIHRNKYIKPTSPIAGLYRKTVRGLREFRAERTAIRDSTFDLKGVSKSLMETFSKRRKEIEADVSGKGITSAAGYASACLSTRSRKKHIAREILFEEWRKTGVEHGFSEREAALLLGAAREHRQLASEANQAVARALARITLVESNFSKRELIRFTAEEAPGKGLSSKMVIEAAENQLAQSKRIITLGIVDGEMRYTTKQMMKMERELKQLIKKSENPFPRIDVGRQLARAVAAKVAMPFLIWGHLNPQQAAAVKHVTEGKQRIKIVSGMAGTGKSTMLKAARRVWELQRYTVIGTALSGKAAEGLHSATGIKSTTLAGLLVSIEGKWIKLNPRTVVVVDEAGMIGTKTMLRLVKEIQKRGAKLVLVGDSGQLQPIEAGSPFKMMAARLHDVKLRTIVRQDDDWAKQSVKDFAQGKIKEALRPYLDRDLVSIKKTRADAQLALIDDWKKEGSSNPKGSLILSATNQEVTELNRRAQGERLKAKAILGASVGVNGNLIYQNDRILFTKRSREFKVENGSFGTVVKLDSRTLTVILDEGRLVSIPLSKYREIQLGYAATTHKAQGMTTKNAFIMLGGPMQDRELSYVQASRARTSTRFYTDKYETGKDLENVTKAMEKSHQKAMARGIEAISKKQKLENDYERRR
jgi:conjugative relaxase-like TrwC/TraI family protein